MVPNMVVALRVLAVSAATGRMAYVFFIGDQLKDWRISDAAARSGIDAAAHVQDWINDLRPNVVVTERTDTSCRKGDKTKDLIGAATRTAEHNYVLDVVVPREREFASKYLEAEAIVKRYPELRPWLPQRRRFFENEPRNTVLFEAITLAEVVIKRPPTDLAAAMG